MLTLYVKTGCPFCIGVQGKVNELGVTVEEKNIADEAHRNELLELGGKQQVPFLVDSERNVSMYESSDIIDYLNEHYGGGGTSDESPERDAAPGVCPVE